MKIFVISGKAGSGKNTSAEYMKAYYEKIGKKCAITEFSKYIKLFAYEIENWDGSRLSKPRSFLQQVGSLARHELFGEDFFVNRLLEDIKIYEKFIDVLVIADARFPNEIDLIKNNCDAVSINIINEFGGASLLNDKEQKHESELALNLYENYDFVIHNQTFEKLQSDIESIVNEVEKI